MKVTPFVICLPFVLGGTFCLSRPAQDELGSDRSGFYGEASAFGIGLYLVQSCDGERPVLAEWRVPHGREWIALSGAVRREELVLGRGPRTPWLKGRFEGNSLQVGLGFWGDRAAGTEPDPDEWIPRLRYERVCPPESGGRAASAASDKNVILKRLASLSDVRFRDGDLSGRCVHPILTGGADALQDAVRRAADEAVQRSRAEWEAFKAEREEGDAGPRRYEECWLVDSLTATGISLVCHVACDSGGAHANYWYRSRTIWLDGDVAREIVLEDLFDACSPWQVALPNLVFDQLKSARATWLEAGEITSFDVESLRRWALTPIGIEFFFAPYEVDCFAAGAYSAFVSYDELRGFLNPVGPVSQFRP